MSPLKVIIHAPTPGAVSRARNNAANLLKADPDAEVKIIINAEGVVDAVNDSTETNSCAVFCSNSLKKNSLEVVDGIEVTASGIVLIAQLQQQGWCYIRA